MKTWCEKRKDYKNCDTCTFSCKSPLPNTVVCSRKKAIFNPMVGQTCKDYKERQESL